LLTPGRLRLLVFAKNMLSLHLLLLLNASGLKAGGSSIVPHQRQIQLLFKVRHRILENLFCLSTFILSPAILEPMRAWAFFQSIFKTSPIAKREPIIGNRLPRPAAAAPVPHLHRNRLQPHLNGGSPYYAL